jgi:MscS family membrane protein
MSASLRRVAPLLAGVVLCGISCAQIPGKAAAATPTPAPQDALGRTTPRGTVFGFLNAGHRGDFEGAAQYLNTKRRGAAAAQLAEQLSVVLDRRLPAKLTKLSDKPEGSQKYPAELNYDLVGTIDSENEPVDILVERLDLPKTGQIWLFSAKTLESIPQLYEEVQQIEIEDHVPAVLKQTRIGGVALIQWLGILVGLPLAYLATVLLNRILTSRLGPSLQRLRRHPDLPPPEFIAGPFRLLIVAALVRFGLAHAALPLLARQVWTAVIVVLTIAAFVWLSTRLSAWIEHQIVARFAGRLLGGAPLLRFVRRAFDLLMIFVGVIVTLRYFGVNTTAALAGLGVGGIAIALAAQKTLENVIGGLSIIFDQTVRLGEVLRVNDTTGTVDSIGLRSTRLRTLDRTMISVPNGQVANATLENFSARDKFRFLHVLGLRYETTAAQVRTVLEEITALLLREHRIDTASVRVRFIRFGASSLDLEMFAYLLARDWNQYLELQQDLLLRIMDIVERAGVEIAFPSQTVYIAKPGAQESPGPIPSERKAAQGTAG